MLREVHVTSLPTCTGKVFMNCRHKAGMRIRDYQPRCAKATLLQATKQ